VSSVFLSTFQFICSKESYSICSNYSRSRSTVAQSLRCASQGRVLVEGASAGGSVRSAGSWGAGTALSLLNTALVNTSNSCLISNFRHSPPCVDNVIELNVVTSTGEYLTVNLHKYPNCSGRSVAGMAEHMASSFL
jgi:hypothetical protein